MTQTIPASSPARSQDTVNLDEPLWQRVVAGGVLVVFSYFAVKAFIQQRSKAV